MPAARIPTDEPERLQTLYEYRILDTMEEESFDSICRLVTSICEVPISLITLVDRRRQWFKSEIGLDVRETSRECSFCAHALLDDDTLIVEDTERDERFRDNPLVLSRPRVRFYAGEPLHAYDGHRLGTLCAIDQEPRRLTEAQKESLRTLARRVEGELELRRVNAELAHVDAQREQLAQFVLHDLRSPLTAILMATERLEEEPGPPSDLRGLVGDLAEAARTLERRVHDLRDVSVGRAGRLAPRWQPLDLRELGEQVAATASLAFRDAGARLHWELGGVEEVEGDPDLLARLLQNLVENALDHTPRGGRVTVRVEEVDAERYVLCVDDEGPGLPPERRERVFELYARDAADSGRGSRGIGLAFCRAAVEAHGGAIEVRERTPAGSTFRAEMPKRRPA